MEFLLDHEIIEFEKESSPIVSRLKKGDIINIDLYDKPIEIIEITEKKEGYYKFKCKSIK